MNSRLSGIALLTLAGSLLFTGCVVENRRPYRRAVIVHDVPPPVVVVPGTEVIVTQPPPPPRTEVIVVRPGPAHVWVPGAWVWRGRAWAWESGRWMLPPRRGVVWVPHRHVVRGGVHVHVHGGWR